MFQKQKKLGKSSELVSSYFSLPLPFFFPFFFLGIVLPLLFFLFLPIFFFPLLF
jgi:hypothetical protein